MIIPRCWLGQSLGYWWSSTPNPPFHAPPGTSGLIAKCFCGSVLRPFQFGVQTLQRKRDVLFSLCLLFLITWTWENFLHPPAAVSQSSCLMHWMYITTLSACSTNSVSSLERQTAAPAWQSALLIDQPPSQFMFVTPALTPASSICSLGPNTEDCFLHLLLPHTLESSHSPFKFAISSLHPS